MVAFTLVIDTKWLKAIFLIPLNTIHSCPHAYLYFFWPPYPSVTMKWLFYLHLYMKRTGGKMNRTFACLVCTLYLLRDKAHVLGSGKLLLPNVVSFPNKASQSRWRVKIVLSTNIHCYDSMEYWKNFDIQSVLKGLTQRTN